LKKILLVGNPNVGKSVIFSKLTGVHVAVSNYPGTTVEFTKGRSMFGGEEVEVIDVPGAYSLEPASKAEEVAVEILEAGDIIPGTQPLPHEPVTRAQDTCDCRSQHMG
jgi:ferrous iron transport protein B